MSGTTKYALLGLLAIAPMSGYDIRQLIPWSIGQFWSESYGQIYPALKMLVAEELAELNVERREDGPERKVYTLTDEGRRHLSQWLELPVVRTPARSELLLKLFFGAHGSYAVIRNHVKACQQEHCSLLAVYEATVARLTQDHKTDPELPFWLMTVSYGKHQSRAVLDWCEETTRVVEVLELQGT